MFFPIPSLPMDVQEESSILLATGCPKELVDKLSQFAEKYRQNVSADDVLKTRRFGTRSLIRIARKLAMFPKTLDLNFIICQSLLAEFIPVTERMDLISLLEEHDIPRKPGSVRPPMLICNSG